MRGVAIEAILEVLMAVSWLDVLDILIVAFVIYRIILLIKGTRTAQILLGFAILAGAYFMSRWANLLTLNWILDNFLSYLILVILILFQDDIRRGLAQVGKNPFLWGRRPYVAPEVIEEVVGASKALAERRVGALIVLERETGLRDLVEKGVRVDARVGKELLQSVFNPQSPIHDGALIISKDMIAAAGCFLPMSTSSRLPKTLGGRHRAALGLSEQSDAVVVVISEERGEISVAHEGTLRQGLSALELRGFLHETMRLKEEG